MFRQEFDPEIVKELTAAFDIASRAVGARRPSWLDEATVRDILASKIIALAKSGETNKLILANNSILHFFEIVERGQTMAVVTGVKKDFHI